MDYISSAVDHRQREDRRSGGDYGKAGDAATEHRTIDGRHIRAGERTGRVDHIIDAVLADMLEVVDMSAYVHICFVFTQ